MSEKERTRFHVGGVVCERPFKIRRFGHIGIYVTDMEKALHFYRDCLGFAISDPLDLGERIEDPEVRKSVGSTIVYFMRHHTDHHSLVLFPKRMMNLLFGNPDWSEWSINQSSWQVGTLREVREGIDWFEQLGLKISRFGRDIPGSNWHCYPFDPDGHTNEIFCGMEQIGWQARSKPMNLFEHGRQYHGKPPIPHISETQEVTDAEARGVDIESGYRPVQPEPLAGSQNRHDVGGLWLDRPFKVVKIGPQRLFVKDIGRSLEHYTDILGFKVTEEVDYRGHRCVFLRVNTEHHSLALYPIALRDELGLSAKTTLMSVGIQLGDYSQLRNAIGYLETRGITVDYLPSELYPGIDYSAFAIDPDGHAVQLYFRMEQIGWDGRPRPYEQRRRVEPGDWPAAVDMNEDTFVGETFLGPLA